MNDKVKYGCSCGSYHPITKIYFCRHCSKLRCGDCVSHEVDSHYCPNCLEYMPSPEARVKKHRCSNCFDCPSCMHTLSIRASSVQLPSLDDPNKTVPKKVYYLACGFCRWTSRDVGIPDQTGASGGWQEQENPHYKRISSLLEYYRVLAQQEKFEKERRKFSQRCGYLHFSDKYGISAVVSRKRAGLSTSSFLCTKEEDTKTLEELVPAEATDEIEPLDSKFISEPLNLSKVCTITQRLFQPEFQPTYSNELFPRHQHLLIKRSQRCRECEHNLSKPEINPSSIKFKIQLAAFYHIPEIRIRKIFPLKYLQESTIELTICNPTPHAANITLLPLGTHELTNSQVKLPECKLIVSARDDTAEFDDINDNLAFKDDPNVVIFRKANKLAIILKILPQKKDEDIKIGFKLQHDFINTVVQLQGDQREPQIVWLTHDMVLNLGRVSE